MGIVYWWGIRGSHDLTSLSEKTRKSNQCKGTVAVSPQLFLRPWVEVRPRIKPGFPSLKSKRGDHVIPHVLVRHYRVYKEKGNRTSARYYTGWVKKNWHLCYSFEYQMYQFFFTHPVHELLGVWTIGFHIRKDQAISYWMTCFSCQVEKK
jgi:Na+(H+)/acetate symporter ActP